jgi:hypothetical protein
MWPELDKKKFKLDEFSAKASLSLNPSAELGAKWSAQKGTPYSRDAGWPPWDSGLVVTAIDALVAKHGPVGSWSDVYDNPDQCDFYSLTGRLKFADSTLATTERIYGTFRFKTHAIEAVFCGELAKDRLQVSLSLENIAGIDRREGEWDVWESGADWMLEAMAREGFDSRGLFTLGATRDPAVSARVVYLAVVQRR